MILNNLSLIKKEKCIDFLISIDNEFIPPLSKKIDFDEFYSKIIKNANVRFIYKENKIIGLIVFYNNLNFAQITLVAVDTRSRGQGLAYNLLSSILNEIDKPIRIITWKENKKAIDLYKRVGFEIIGNDINEYGINQILMEKK